jgi:hypothetical protein
MIPRLVALWLIAALPLDAFSLKSGDHFPGIPFPPIEGGDEVNVSSFAGKKLMLHLFASW